MADWNLPTLTDLYTNFLSYLKSRDVDASTLFVSAPTNPPTGAMKYVRASNKFQEWDGAAWQDKTLAIAGGGTGSTTASTARTALGLGTIATQDANNVAITGGTISGVTISVASFSGTIPLANGGTGAALALGANGTVMQSTGAAVSFALIVNQNVDAAAAIAWSKISKVASSLADLATRSASDLSSGTLPDARFPATLPAISGANLTNLPIPVLSTLSAVVDGAYTASGNTEILAILDINDSLTIETEGISFISTGNGYSRTTMNVSVRDGQGYNITTNAGTPLIYKRVWS